MEVTSIRTDSISGGRDLAGSTGAELVLPAPAEWKFGTVEGSVLAYVPDVAAATPEDLDPSREVWVGCETGHRAHIAASILHTRGFDPVVLTGAGIAEVVAALGSG